MDKIKKMWCNLSLRKSIILYISAFVILAILLSAGTATLCNNATKTIESKYPPTGEKYYLTNENICKILCEHHGGYLKIENCSIGAKVTAFFKSLD